MKNRPLYACSLLWLVLCGAYLAWWHHMDTRPLTWDPTVHIGLAMDYRDWLVHGTPIGSSRTSMYPPLYHISLIPSLLVGAASQGKAVLTHVFYMGLLLVALIGLLRRMNRSPYDALIATILITAYPWVQFIVRYVLTDYPLLVWVALGMWRLYETDDFSDKRNSLIWGVTAGLGMLVKQTYPLFFFIPCIWMLRPKRGDNVLWRQRAKNLGWGLATILLVALPWYWWQNVYALQNGLGQAFERGVAQHLPDFRSLEGWLWYVRILKEQLGAWGLYLTVAGILLLPLARGRLQGTGFIALWALSGYVGNTLIHNKDPRYDLPIVPALALLSVIGWTGVVKPKISRAVLAVLVIGLCFWNAKQIDPPLQENWKHQEIGELLQARHDTRQPFLVASVPSDNPYFFGRSVRWSLRTRGILLYTGSAGKPDADFTEFLLLKSAYLGPDSGAAIREWEGLQAQGRSFSEVYQRLAEFPLPDTSHVTVYQKDKDHVFRVSPLTTQEVSRRLHAALEPIVNGPFTVVVESAPAELKYGRVAKACLQSGGPVTVKDAPITQLRLCIEEAWFNLYMLWDHQKPGMLAFKSLHPEVEIHAADVQALLRRKVRHVDQLEVHFSGGALRVTGLWKSVRLAVGAHISKRENANILRVNLDQIKLGFLPIPTWILGRAKFYDVPLDPIPSFPGKILINHVQLENDVLKID